MMSQYSVMIDDNFHYMDEAYRLHFGTFSTAEEAVVACRRIVDDWLALHRETGMTAEQLFERYVCFGEDPYVVPPDGARVPAFSAWDYARERARALCEDR